MAFSFQSLHLNSFIPSFCYVFCLFLIFVLSLTYGLFKFQVFAAARALFSLDAYCDTVLLLLGEMDGHLRGHHFPICVLKAKVSNFTFHIFPCFVFKISLSFIFLYYLAYILYNHLQFSCCLRSNLLLSNGRSWIYSINLLASQYSFDSSLEVWSSFGHTRR